MGSPVNILSSKALRNLLINGNMRFDQRREGGLLTLGSGASVLYTCDRWRQDRDVSATTVTSRSSASPPDEFSHFQRLSVTTGATVTALQFNEWLQIIEGQNIANTKFGTAQAQDLGLSFLVRSSVVGPCSGVIRNNAGRSYVFSFNIDVANTWEYKAITIPGDVGGTWNLIGNTLGMVVGFCHSAGTSYRTTAGSWQNGLFVGATGGNNVTATTGATYDLTGVQLKIGPPTGFEHRSQADDFRACMRYFQVASRPNSMYPCGNGGTSAQQDFTIQLPVEMRTSPAVTGDQVGNNWRVWSNTAGTAFYYAVNNSSMSFPVVTNRDIYVSLTQTNPTGTFISGTVLNAAGFIHADAEL